MTSLWLGHLTLAGNWKVLMDLNLCVSEFSA